MDKLSLGFFADVLYIKGIICFDEYDDIMEAVKAEDLDTVVEKMLSDEYNVYKRGEAYVGYGR